MIRVLRTKRGWSLRQAAERAGIGHSTLSRWERGEAQPSEPELARYYAAFGLARPLPRPVTEGRPVAISRADLLRALRGRQGLSLDLAADRLGLSKPVLSRYESGARTPAPDAAAEYAHRLGGDAAAVAAARDGMAPLPDDPEARLAHLLRTPEGAARNLDLEFLTLDGWLRSQRGSEARRLALSGAYVRWLGWWYRDREANRWARRDLGLMDRHPDSPAWGRLVRAHAAHVSEVDREPRRAADLLAAAVQRQAGYESEAFLRRELAGALVGLGSYAEAGRALDAARRTRPSSDEGEEGHAFCCDAVEAGIWAAQGEYDRAFRVAYDRLPPNGFLRFALAGSRADALAKAGEAGRAVRELADHAQAARADGLEHFALGLDRRMRRLATVA